MKKALVALLVMTSGASALIGELPTRRAPDHIGHGEDHAPPGHDPQPHRVGGPRPGDPGFGLHTPPNRHTRGVGNEHDNTHHVMEMHYEEQIQALHDEAREIHHKHGHESAEAHDHDLKIQKVRNRRRALNFKQHGMPEDEYDHLVSLLDQLLEMQHRPHVRAEEMEEVHKSDADLQARHEEMTKHHALEKQIREIEQHYEHVPLPKKNVGTAEERKAMHELHKQIHATHDRAERRKLRREYQLKQQHMHDDQHHHKHLSEEEIAKVKALREELLAETDRQEIKAIRADIEDIYRPHRHRRKLHHRNPNHPDNQDPSREEDDEILISLRQKMHSAETREERKALQEEVRDRIHELHFGHVDEDIRPKRRRKKEREPRLSREGAELDAAARVPKPGEEGYGAPTPP